MATYDYRLKYTIYDYSSEDLTGIPLNGEKRYYDTIISGQLNPVYVLGDGSSQVNQLPFIEKLEISTGSNVDLEDLRITDNHVQIYNSGSSNITVQTGVTGSLKYKTIRPKTILRLYFDGIYWRVENTNQAYGINTCKLYDDSGTLKMTIGFINLDNGSGNELVYYDSVETISITGITNSRWFTVELSRVGDVPTLTAVELATDTNPYELPASIDSYYDPEKGGYYRVGTARIVGFGWKATGGTLAGILNVDSIVEGYAGYSTGEVIGHIYEWDKKNEDIKDRSSSYIGKLYLLDDTERPTGWILSAGNDTTWTDIIFTPYVPVGVRAVYIKGLSRFDGDGALDSGYMHFRENGSTTTDLDQLARLDAYRENMPAGLGIGSGSCILIECDEDGIIEYETNDALCENYVNLLGYSI